MFICVCVCVCVCIEILCRDERWDCAILNLLLAPPSPSAPCPAVRKVTADYGDDEDDDDDDDGLDGNLVYP